MAKNNNNKSDITRFTRPITVETDKKKMRTIYNNLVKLISSVENK